MDRKPAWFYKTFVVGALILFIGTGIQPAIAIVEPMKELIDCEPKDYLFQTIIDIANNPDVKKLFKQNENDLYRSDIDNHIFSKILFKNPKILLGMILTAPSFSIVYLNKCYNKGIAVTKIIGEDKVLDVIESFESTNKNSFHKIYDIISKDKEIANRLLMLKDMNKNINIEEPFQNKAIICLIILVCTFLSIAILGTIINILDGILGIFPFKILGFFIDTLYNFYMNLLGVLFLGMVYFCGFYFP